jgi:hypothetical protein
VIVDKFLPWQNGTIEIKGRKVSIINPEKLVVSPDIPIIIVSKYYQEEIAKEIKEIYNITNPLVTLF